MNAMEKVAWTNLLVSLAAVGIATALSPWLGGAATRFFALLALIPLGVIFLRQRGARVVVDERDREIDRRAGIIAVGATWMLLVTTLAVATVWSNYTKDHAISTVFLNWLIWIQFATYFGMRGLAAVVLYRRQHAS